MCGVVGLIYERFRPDLGIVASELLRALEYRGYDSTGAAVQGEGEEITLVKGVGAPSVMVDELGIRGLSGQLLCGQVRWATFGAVDDRNAQPHEVRCRAHLYGAHNGNVTNCDELKVWLVDEGHRVRSDNDGEMVVHTVEHLFARQLEELAVEEREAPAARRAAMRRAVVLAGDRLEGSFAAVIVDPKSRTLWAIKAGSSLYFGVGEDPEAGRFHLASSDLSAVLRLTRVLVPLSEGELVEFDDAGWSVFPLRDAGGAPALEAEALERSPVRSRLRAKDAALLPPFESFMEQEISAQEATSREWITLFQGGSDACRALAPAVDALPELRREELHEELTVLRGQVEDDRLRDVFHRLVDRSFFRELCAGIPPELGERLLAGSLEQLVGALASGEKALLADLLPTARDDRDRLAIRLLDAALELEEVRELETAVHRFLELALECRAHGGRIFAVCCGSSYHAAKAASLFFNHIARTELIPVLPGEYRAQYSRSLVDGDLFVAVSQSGETKDLIDVLDDVTASGHRIAKVAVVNNVSSTLALEKSDLVIPLRCGMEIAVPATKSFMAQLVLFYGLAIRLGRALAEAGRLPEGVGDEVLSEARDREERLIRIPELLRETVESTRVEVEEAAQLLYLRPSLHILATRLAAVAREGALKVREVVLNHTEGFEGSEFKHGPNTILGWNTVFGPDQVAALLRRLGSSLDTIVARAGEAGLGVESLRRLVQAATDGVFSPAESTLPLSEREEAVLQAGLDHDELLASLYADYPLIFVTGPSERDVALTVSQINTHKIRGATTVVIAEDHPALRQAAVKAPADNPTYHAVYVTLPRTRDTLMTTFSATVVLQRLALEMSVLKMSYLDRLGLPDHGVHPDVPKNVSKSITVD